MPDIPEPRGPQEVPLIVDNTWLAAKMIDIQQDSHAYQMTHAEKHGKIDKKVAVIEERQKVGTWLGRVFFVAAFMAMITYIASWLGINLTDKPHCPK